MIPNLIYKTIVGSQSYGTSIPTSDVDYKGVYQQNPRDILSFNYKEQIEVGKDECYYEVRRFLQLVQTANPTMLEMLFMPDKFIVEKNPVMDIILQHKHKFLTKKCRDSFGGYAIAQIQKSKGLDKKMNWEKEKIERKNPIDFVYVSMQGKVYPITEYLEDNGLLQELCGLVALDHFRDCYALYYDTKNFGYKGITIDEGNSVRLSSVPKGEKPIVDVITFNKDAYSIHCKNYKEYQHWLKNRNIQRYVDTEKHGQKIDGKNLLHCRRLLDVAIEIAQHGTITVTRPNADYLLKIRRGEVQLDSIIEQAEKDIQLLDELYQKSTLPNQVDKEFVNELLLEVREYTTTF